jgi:hypothetical protein
MVVLNIGVIEEGPERMPVDGAWLDSVRVLMRRDKKAAPLATP